MLLGESPVWDDRAGRLYWVDIDAGRLHWLELASSVKRTWMVGSPLGSVCLASGGRVVLTIGCRIYVADVHTHKLELVARVEGDESEMRINDSACDPSGRLWTGTMRADGTGDQGALYRVAGGHDGVQLRKMFDGVGISNGIAWDPEGRRMYYIDTPTHRIDVMPFDDRTGDLGPRTVLVDMAPARPDGMTVDADGFLWVAVPSDGQVRRYSASGRLERSISFPTRRVTSCCFGGPALDELYVTSARPRDAAGDALGGALYMVRPGVRGLTTSRYLP